MKCRMLMIALLFSIPVAAEEPASIVLRDRVVATKRCVRLGDIAQIKGGTPRFVQQIVDLDIDDLPATGKVRKCPAAQVDARLRLAGISPSEYVLTGAAEVVITADRRTVPAAKIEEAAREEAFRHVAWPKDECLVRLLQPITVPLPALADDDVLTLEAEPARKIIGPGRTQINVTVRINGERRLDLAVFLDLQMAHEVAICKRRIERGEVIVEADILRERRPASQGQTLAAKPEAIVGRVARWAIGPGHIMVATDVEQTAAISKNAIRSGDSVRLVVRLGNIDVVAIGEAQQSGTLGDTIRVKNIDSKKVVVGRVTGPRTVEVDTSAP